MQKWWEGRRERRYRLNSDYKLQNRQTAELQFINMIKNRNQRQSVPFGRERERGIL